MNKILNDVKKLSKVSKESWEFVDGRRDIYNFDEDELERLLEAFDESLSIIRAFLVAYPQPSEPKKEVIECPTHKQSQN